MSDWAVGDLVVCVDNERQPRLEVGKAYRVAAVGLTISGASASIDVEGIERFGGDRPECPNFAVRRFRKIRPDEHEACEAEFATLLKRSKRKVDA